MNITRNQWIAIFMLALGLIAGGTSQLTELFGAGVAKNLASSASFLSSFVAGLQIILGGQGMQVKDVRAMDGVQNIEVNAKANPTLAALAIDPAEDKISIAPGASAQVNQTAKAG